MAASLEAAASAAPSTLVFRQNLPDQAGLSRLFGGETLPHRQHGESALIAHDARAEQRRTGFRHDREIGERRLEHGARRSEGQVAMHMHGDADADGDAVDRRQKRLGEAGKLMQESDDILGLAFGGGDLDEIARSLPEEKHRDRRRERRRG